MTEQQQREARERLEKATPGPWFEDSYSHVAAHGTCEELKRERHGDKSSCGEGFIEIAAVPTSYGDTSTGRHNADMAFIANAPNDLRLALDALDRVRALVAAFKTPGARIPAYAITDALDGPTSPEDRS